MTEHTRLINIIKDGIGGLLPKHIADQIAPKIADRLIKGQAEQARREAATGEIKEIKITYKDGREKFVGRGVCFSVYEKADTVHVSCDGVAGSERDEVAVLAIVSRIAKELGISDELCEKAEVTDNA